MADVVAMIALLWLGRETGPRRWVADGHGIPGGPGRRTLSLDLTGSHRGQRLTPHRICGTVFRKLGERADTDFSMIALGRRRMRFAYLTGAFAGSVLAFGAATAADLELPKQLAWTAYGTGTAGYNQSVAIGAALKNAAGTDLRVLPGKNDVARTEPLRQGKVQFSATGVGRLLHGARGRLSVRREELGPATRSCLMANNGGRVGLSLAVAAAACEKAGKPGCEGFEYSDLKGMRVAWVKGAPALNVNNEAYLAYGGLTWDDVEKVEFGGFSASGRA